MVSSSSCSQLKALSLANGLAIAFILGSREFRMLFTSDAGVGAERRLLHEAIDLQA